MKSDSSYSSAHSSSSHSFSSSANQSHLPDRDFNYTPADASERAVAKGGVACPFPWRLHEMLKVASEEGLEHIVSWAPHGKAFTVYKPQEFADLIMKRYVPGSGCLCLHSAHNTPLRIDTHKSKFLAADSFAKPSLLPSSVSSTCTAFLDSATGATRGPTIILVFFGDNAPLCVT